MKVPLCLLAVCAVLGAGCASHRPAAASNAASDSGAAPELTGRDFLFAVLRYLYRWHLDSEAWATSAGADEIEIRVRTIPVATDEGDRSRFAELWLPGAELMVELKQSDHEVPERGLRFKDDGFKVRAVHRVHAHSVPADGWTTVRLAQREVMAHLHQTRRERLFPDAAFEGRLRNELAAYLRQHHEAELLDGAQTFFAAPVSPVSNELWLYWENQRTALRFAADGDLADPRTWAHLTMHLRVVPIDERVALSSDESQGAAKAIPRAWAGRLLYNCVVLGRKFSLPAADGR